MSKCNLPDFGVKRTAAGYCKKQEIAALKSRVTISKVTILYIYILHYNIILRNNGHVEMILDLRKVKILFRSNPDNMIPLIVLNSVLCSTVAKSFELRREREKGE